MQRNLIVANAVKNYIDGHYVSNDDIEITIPFLRDTVIPFLSSCGDRYVLVASDLKKILSSLEDFKTARKRHG